MDNEVVYTFRSLSDLTTGIKTSLANFIKAKINQRSFFGNITVEKRQTFLERVKSIFNGIVGLSPDKITPTVGLNSMWFIWPPALSLLYRLRDTKSNLISINFKVGKISYSGSRLNFWDLGGASELHGLWEKYYSECHAVIFVIDSTNIERIGECKMTFENLITNEKVAGIPILMLANKQDVSDSLKMDEILKIFKKVAMRLGARDSKVLLASALEGDGIREAIDWLYLRLQRNRQNRPPVMK
ncbi:hypothetical protein G9A89_011369 [Geosiphon pyriformis]|nr:hypothetical protein G9A89_011369 [Geosiphon pyriformis]